jgi:hypothetical protein
MGEDWVSDAGAYPAQPDDQKLEELILYVSWKCEGDSTFGATKLNKILFFSDFRAYVQLGRAITDQEYRALDQGPAPRRLREVRGRMVRAQALVIRERDFFGRRQDQTIPLRRPDLSLFSSSEIAIVDWVIDHWWERTATEMSRASHEFVGWRLARPGETIPYETALFEPHEPTSEEMRQAEELEQLFT